MGLFVICSKVIRAIRSIVLELFIGRICETRFRFILFALFATLINRGVPRCLRFLDDIGGFVLLVV
jgi:hypothetical protein